MNWKRVVQAPLQGAAQGPKKEHVLALDDFPLPSAAAGKHHSPAKPPSSQAQPRVAPAGPSYAAATTHKAPSAPPSAIVPSTAPAQQQAPPSALSAAAPECQAECCVCLDASPAAVGVPCGHVTLCVACSGPYLNKHVECPACAGQLEALFVPGRGLVKRNAWAAQRSAA